MSVAATKWERPYISNHSQWAFECPICDAYSTDIEEVKDIYNGGIWATKKDAMPFLKAHLAAHKAAKA